MLTVMLGDITKVKADAIVNAANTSLLGGGGVDGAIHRAAGPKLLEECRMLNCCWNGGGKNEEQLLRNCYENCLKLAAEYGCKTVAFPSISTGIYRFPLEKASLIAVETIRDFLTQHSDMDVQMVCFDQRTFQYYQQAMKEK